MDVQAFHGVVLSGRDFRALPRRFAFRKRRALSATAAILSEIAEQRVHLLELGRVDHRTAFTAHGDKTRRPEPIEVKRQGVRSKVERGSHRPRRHPFRSGLHEQPEHIETIVLRKRRESPYRICLFHNSTIIEIMAARQPGRAGQNGIPRNHKRSAGHLDRAQGLRDHPRDDTMHERTEAPQDYPPVVR
jgi:hypothetical protein